MWLIDWIMGIIFGKSKDKRLFLSRSELLDRLDDAEKKGNKDAEQKVFARIAEVKHLINNAESKIREIGEKEINEEEGNARLRRVVSSSKTVLIGKFTGMLEKIRPPAALNFSDAWQYVRSSKAVLTKEIVDLRKSISYTGIMLKDEMRELGSTFEEIGKALDDADAIIEKTRIAEMEAVRDSLSGIENEVSVMADLGRGIAAIEADIKELEAHEDSEIAIAKQLRESPEMRAADNSLQRKADASRKKQELKGKLVEKLGTIDRPLQRFSQLVESRKHIIDKELEDILRLYMTNPFIAIKRDPKGTELKKILKEVRQLVDKDEIALKEREKEKKLEALDDLIEYNFFDEVFWELNKADAELNKADKELSGSGIYSGISSHEDSARRRRSEIDAKLQVLDGLAQKKSSHEEQIQKAKVDAEAAATSFFGDSVSLRLDD